VTTIWKYILHIADEITIGMPEGAVVLSVQDQQGIACLWVKVDPTKPKVNRDFAIFGTGHPINRDRLHFIGTIQQHEGALVWHVFEVLAPTVRGV
jgi:hypothetical protein